MFLFLYHIISAYQHIILSAYHIISISAYQHTYYQHISISAYHIIITLYHIHDIIIIYHKGPHRPAYRAEYCDYYEVEIKRNQDYQDSYYMPNTYIHILKHMRIATVSNNLS